MRRVRLVLLVVPALWGLVFVAVDQVLRYLDAFQLVTIRFLMISAAFGILMLTTPRFRPHYTRDQWRLVWLAGLMAVPVSQLSSVYAQNYLEPTLAALVITTSPAVMAVLAPIFLPEKVTWLQGMGFAVALTGAAVVIVAGAGGMSFSGGTLLGATVGLVTPISWAIYTILLKKLSLGEPLATIGIGLVVGSVFLLPWVPSVLPMISDIEGATWGWLVYLVCVTILTYLIWFWSLQQLNASQTSAYLYIVPLFTLLWSLLILGEVPSTTALAGGALVFAGVALTQRAGTVRQTSSET